jgi:hypothetical protein
MGGRDPVVHSLGDIDLCHRYLVETVDSYIKICLAANQSYKVFGFLVNVLRGVYGPVSNKHRAQLHTRAAICAIKLDHSCVLHHVKRAKVFLGKHMHPFDLLLFYCVYGWAHVNRVNGEGSEACGILSFKHAERIAPSDIVSTKIVDRTRQCLSIICRVSDGSIIESVDEIVSLQNIADRSPLDHLFSCVNKGFRLRHRDQLKRSRWYNNFRRNKEALFTEMVELYSLVPTPLSGQYIRGAPDTITMCVNEFLSIYTEESNKYQINERDVSLLEKKYHIQFNRDTFKFKWN